MKLFPPDPAVDLYETGFDDSDPFNRVGTGKTLSDLVERIEDPLVIAVDGQWGSGKTWFLKRWVGAHGKQNSGRARTVYFDAFSHDFGDDPLVALAGVIDDRLPKQGEGKVWDKFKTAASRLARPTSRIALAVLSGGITEATGPVLDAAVSAASEEVKTATDAMWAREEGKRAAMEQLRSALIELTMFGISDGDSPIPLVVVVDELDRCRPDYALSLLEVIKHFFSVPNVHFVLGANLDALGHSVRARYGAGIDAERYLRKFVSVSMRLPEQTAGHDAQSVALAYFMDAGRGMGINRNGLETFEEHVRLATSAQALTMRDMNQILSRLALVNPEIFTRRLPGWQNVLASLILFEFATPALDAKAIKGALSLDDVRNFYGLTSEMLSDPSTGFYDRRAWIISGTWEHIITQGAGPAEDRESFSKLFDPFGYRRPQNIPQKIHAEFLSTFSILSGNH